MIVKRQNSHLAQEVHQDMNIDDNDKLLVQFHHPGPNEEVIDRFIVYRMKVDGIKCSEFSYRSNTIYEAGFEIANSNEDDRVNGLLTCQGMVFTKTDDSLNQLKDYLIRFTVLGVHGFYTQVKIHNKKVWYHWKWFIGSVICDTVAQEELIGCLNKKFTSKPCVFCDTDRVRFNPELYLHQLFSQTIQSSISKRYLSFPCGLYHGLHPNSLIRCASLICHVNKDDLERIFSICDYTLTAVDKEEIESIEDLYNMFPNPHLLHQYNPVAIPSNDLTQTNETHIRTICSRMNVESEKVDSLVNEINQESTSKKTISVNVLEDSLLIPSEKALGVDGMHNLYNVCLMFIKLLNKVPKGDKKLDCLMKELLEEKMNEKSSWTLLPDFSKVKEDANKRKKELENLNLPYVKEDLLNESHFKTASDYKGIVFLCSYYHYLFQDSMHIPFVFLYKIILDYMVYFFNANHDMKSIVEHQLNFNIIVSLLQNEVAPSVCKPSLHYACHYAETIINTGDIISSNCFKSENAYRIYKICYISCSNPVLNVARRNLAFKSAELIFKTVPKNDKKAVINLRKESDNHAIDFTPEFLEKVCRCNLYDELMYYQDSSYSHVTLLDLLLNSNRDEWERIVDKYIRENSIVCHRLEEKECFIFENSVVVEDDTIKNVVFKDGELNNSNLVFTRANNGELLVFYVFGEVECKIGDEVFTNYLCFNVPVISGSSCVNTSLYGFLDLDAFKQRLAEQQEIFVVSRNRVIINHLRTFGFKNLTSFITNKLVVAEFDRIGNNKLYDNLLSRM